MQQLTAVLGEVSARPEERRRRWNRRRGRRSVRWSTAKSPRLRPSQLAVLGVGGEGSTVVPVVVSEWRGELSNAGGDGSRRRGGFGCSGVRERKRGNEGIREREEKESTTTGTYPREATAGTWRRASVKQAARRLPSGRRRRKGEREKESHFPENPLGKTLIARKSFSILKQRIELEFEGLFEKIKF